VIGEEHNVTQLLLDAVAVSFTGEETFQAFGTDICLDGCRVDSLAGRAIELSSRSDAKIWKRGEYPA
jgi:hypothetical protein